MKPAAMAILLAIGLSACSGSSSTASPDKAAPKTPAVVEIPVAADQPISKLEKNTKPFSGDFDAIVERGYLRILVAPSRTYFQTSDAGHKGLAVDAGVAFAQRLSEEAKREIAPVFIETREDQLIPSLLAGKGDVAANVLLTFAHEDQVAFAAPIKKDIRELIVTDVGKGVVSLEDAGGRMITVRKNSAHHESLMRLNEQLTKNNRRPAFIVADEKTKTDEDMLDSVNAGRVKATVVDDYIFDRWQGGLIKLANTNRDVSVSQDGVLAWVTRKDAPKLLALMNDFFSTHKLTF